MTGLRSIVGISGASRRAVVALARRPSAAVSLGVAVAAAEDRPQATAASHHDHGDAASAAPPG